jgi:osmotically-inducible protein OsmY
MDTETDSKVSQIRERLEDHPHFRGRTHLLQIEAIGGSVVVSGRLPTYHLKQLLQEAVRAIPGVSHIDNCVDVTYQ